jgi:hypothetical protein
VGVLPNGNRVLRTSHGAYLQTEDRSRHAWLYVFPGGGRKLRHPSVQRVEVDQWEVRITVRTDVEDYQVLRFDGRTGNQLRTRAVSDDE